MEGSLEGGEYAGKSPFARLAPGFAQVYHAASTTRNEEELQMPTPQNGGGGGQNADASNEQISPEQEQTLAQPQNDQQQAQDEATQDEAQA